MNGLKSLDSLEFHPNSVSDQKVASFQGQEGILYIGKAQEKASVFRTETRWSKTGTRYPWVVRGTAMPNHYYLVDEDFGPMFVKFCSYFPYGMKICLNGHEWLKKLNVPHNDNHSRVHVAAFGKCLKKMADGDV